jgi:hypothetical protein
MQAHALGQGTGRKEKIGKKKTRTTTTTTIIIIIIITQQSIKRIELEIET